eukprot:TRINITY_DN3771_c0_g3_i2.p1 TRINITY_DN3771_c0_g3~~TRINITY_DN3771_c0_g3_i2.p1  ORF type:complete len:227 (+),score=56.42 TRINITY_DN3771_c0_g3_i2:49-729(+)
MCIILYFRFFFFQAEDGIRDAQESRGLGDVYKRQSRRRNYDLSKHRTDQLISYMKGMIGHSFALRLMTATALDTFAEFEDLVEEHRRIPETSTLRHCAPSVGTFFTPLPLKDAFSEYDHKYKVTLRESVPPSFNELRHILNLAQIMAFKPTDPLRMMTFDGDLTLYQDGGNFQDPKLIRYMMKLLSAGVHVALVTAASYMEKPEQYEQVGVGVGVRVGYKQHRLGL